MRMLKKLVTVCLLSLHLSALDCYADFEYNGRFDAASKSNDTQSYYILLSEKNIVSFNIKDQKGDFCQNVYVSNIKQPSGSLASKTAEGEIKSFVVPSTGIYEVEVSLKGKTDKDLPYSLIVNESENTLPNTVSAVSENTAVSSETAAETKEITLDSVAQTEVKEQSQEIQITEISEDIPESSLVVVAEPLGPDSVAEEPEEPLNNQELKAQSEREIGYAAELGTNTMQIGAEPNSIAEKKPIKAINYNGKLTLVKDWDSSDLPTEKNKSWIKAVAFDENSNLWVLDGQLNKISCYSKDGAKIKAFGSKGSEPGSLGLPVSIAVFNNNIIVGDRQKHCVFVFDFNGNLVNIIQSSQNLGLEIANPVSIMIRNQEIWIADAGTNRVLCFDSEYRFLGSFGSTDESRIDSIAGADTDGNSIYILEEEGILKKFGPMGNFESAFSTNISFASQLYIDYSNNFWVVDSENNVICCISPKGEVICRIDEAMIKGADEKSRMFCPTAVSVDTDAQIIIADVGSKQIKVFELK